MKTLETYFRENYNKAIDYTLRVSISADDIVTFYIHAQNVNSDTLDFKVENNILTKSPYIIYPEDKENESI